MKKNIIILIVTGVLAGVIIYESTSPRKVVKNVFERTDFFSEPLGTGNAGVLPPVENYLEPHIIGIEAVSAEIIKFYVSNDMTKEDFTLSVEYFLAALTIPSKDLWVNLQLGQRNKVSSYYLGKTELGKTMLKQDYLLKVATATTTYEETPTGKAYWKAINTKGRGGILRTCIIPGDIEIVDDNSSMRINTAILDVEIEALFANGEYYEEIVEQTILPEIKRYVRDDIHFAPIRQAYRAVICAIWFKNKYSGSVYQYYINQDKTSRIRIKDMRGEVWDRFALMRKNLNWYNPETSRSYSGVEFKKPTEVFKIVRGKNNFEKNKYYKVRMITSELPVEKKSQSGLFDKIPVNLGGISLDATLNVRKGTLKAIEGWKGLTGLDYFILIEIKK